MTSNWMAAAAAVLAISFIVPFAQAKPIIIAEGAHAKTKAYNCGTRYGCSPRSYHLRSRQHESWRGNDRDYEYRRALRQMR